MSSEEWRATRRIARPSGVHAHLALAQTRTLGGIYDQSMARTSFTLIMLAIAASMAVLLGTVGLYGVVAYTVSRRRREIGVRVALGAGPRDVLRVFLKQGLLLAAVGVLLGLLGAAATTRLMDALLFGVTPLDPITFTLVPALLAAVVLLATYLPARRATAVNPAEAIRAD